MDQHTFMETLASVKEIMQVQENPLTEEEMLSYFAEMHLSDAQKKMVIEYLTTVPEETEENATEESEQETVGEEEKKISAIFQMYMEELGELPQYTHTQELEMYRALLSGDEGMIRKLLDCWLERVIEHAKGYMTPKILIEDLVQEGNVALFMKLQELCGAGKCDDIEDSLIMAMEEAMMNYASTLTQEMDLEEAMLAKLRLVYAARKYMTEENGSVPTIAALSDYTKIPQEELRQLIEILDESEEESEEK
ncbi:MAG: hypothetical protein Q4D51_12685 [Eubacteriales bacterium]|nr:hypothetical protein [Eubacteriales bacterium]